MPAIIENRSICSLHELFGQQNGFAVPPGSNGTLTRNSSMPGAAHLKQELGVQWRRPMPITNGGNGEDTTRQRAASRIEASLNHMLQNLDKPLRVSTLSAVSRVSPSQFFVLFKSATGHAPIDFFIRLRMQRACELLRNRDLSVKEVAGVLGYDDPFYFSRVFKSVVGIAPRGYRAKISGDQTFFAKTTTNQPQ